MLRTLSIVVSIGLADSVNASTIGPALFLAGGGHPRRSVLEFTLGVVAVFFLGGALLVAGPGRALLSLVPHPSQTARYIVETIAGVAMLVGAVVLWTRRRSLSRNAHEDRKRREAGGQAASSEEQAPNERERGQDGDEGGLDDGGRTQGRSSPALMDPDDGARTQGRSAPTVMRLAAGERTQRRRSPALMGAAIAAAELPTAFPYFAAIATIVSSRLGIGRELLLVAVYDVCFTLPLFGIIIVLRVAGDGATQKLARMRGEFEAHWPALAAGAALVAGVYITALGVTGLASGLSGRTGRVARRVRHVIAR